ncbi:MAG: 30S ribosomal protein S12 methylthiotransferase RimO [Oscillospiraceae bacterium]|nr:30S ribosomal protein S12 methylthiotransferase RimO [Oscillospiraceae bacterium]
MIKLKTSKIAIVSLGCPKNQCDAEIMLAKIAGAGYRLVPEPGQADVVIINTCCFIQSAKEEAIEEILEAASRKKDGINKKIIVTGCLSERYKQQLADEFPEIDGVLALANNSDIVEAINTVLLDKKAMLFGGIENHCMEGERLLSTLPHYAYLRIADGCDNRCSYCAIPLFRGKYRSRPMGKIIEEAVGLVENGVRELILVAQDVTGYGSDFYDRDGSLSATEGVKPLDEQSPPAGSSLALIKLLLQLTKIDKLKWIRLLYCYPQHMTDELIEVIQNEPKIVKYLDLPIQHCNDEILSKMNRTGNKKMLTDLIVKLRNAIPGLILRTTVLVGFPGETDEQFTELAEFVHAPDTRFEHLGCFAYSEEEGTSAAEMPDQVDISERERRQKIILEQQDIRVAEFLDSFIGNEVEVVVEGFDRYAELFFGRCYGQAPEIDSMIYFTSEVKEEPADGLCSSKGLTPSEVKPVIGNFVKVKITENVDNNLIGEML